MGLWALLSLRSRHSKAFGPTTHNLLFGDSGAGPNILMRSRGAGRCVTVTRKRKSFARDIFYMTALIVSQHRPARAIAASRRLGRVVLAPRCGRTMTRRRPPQLAPVLSPKCRYVSTTGGHLLNRKAQQHSSAENAEKTYKTRRAI